jgi:hypothetical protein
LYHLNTEKLFPGLLEDNLYYLIIKNMTNNLNKRYDVTKTFEYNKEHGPFEKVYDKNDEIKKILGDY